MIVVTGTTGQLGTAFRAFLGEDAQYPTRSDLDLSDLESLRQGLEHLQPTVLINCAAFTAVDRAESEPEMAAVVNTDAVGVMAEAMAGLGGRFVTFSTNYVFDGTANRPYLESDPTRPINVYGQTKRAGEIAALTACAETLVVRTSWLLSGTHPNFASTIIRLAREGEVTVVDDQYGHPTLVKDLARATLSALEASATGILHLANTGITNWFSLAQEVAGLAGIDPNRIRACASVDRPTAAMRPGNSGIASSRSRELGLEPLPPYHRGLPQAIKEILSWIPEAP